MAKKLPSRKVATKSPSALRMRRASEVQSSATEYASVLTDLTQAIHTSRHRAMATVNRELVGLYWHIGRVIVHQQETANWGDAVVEQLAADLRGAFPDMKGLTKDNLFRMRKFYAACLETDEWLVGQSRDNVATTSPQLPMAGAIQKVGAAPPLSRTESSGAAIVSTLSGESHVRGVIVGALSPQLRHEEMSRAISSLSWTQLTMIMGAVDQPSERYFYMAMSVRERWSVRELRRQIDADLFTRYVSVKSHPEKCLPDDAECGDLLPFKDHYVLEFLGLEDEHSEKELRKAIFANLRNFFLEFGKDLTFVGEEYPLTVGADTFYIDLLFFHRRLQCLIAVDLKRGKFKPEHAGKSRFYCAALDEQLRLSHENPSLGLVLCRSADTAQVRLALTTAAERIGIATYQTALPDETQLRRRLEQLPQLPEDHE